MSHPLTVIPNQKNSDEKPWYAEGLKFECTQCGACCTGAPGYAWVTDEEIVAISNHLKLSIQEFGKKYLRYVNGRYALLENQLTFACIFLRDKKCSIYSVRPTQCRTFPWWQKNLASKEAWDQAATFCEGIKSTAPTIPYNIIQDQLAEN